MPYSHKLKRVDEETGIIREDLIPGLLKELKSPHKVAARLDVAPNTIRWWLQTHGYRFVGDQWQYTEVEPTNAN